MATPLRNILTSLHGRLVGLDVNGSLIVRSQVDGALITNAAGATNVCTATIQLQNNEGAAVATSAVIDVWVSDAATGIGLTANANTSEVTATTGTLMGISTADKAWKILTDATGKAVLSITDTGKHGTFVACSIPNRAAISVAAVACAYG
jgi:hypothetical protein